MRPTSPILAAAAVLAIVGLGLGLERLVPLPPAEAVHTVEAGPATSGAWYCAVGGTVGGSELSIVTAAPPSEATEPTEVVVRAFAEGDVETVRRGNAFPSSSTVGKVEQGTGPLGIATRWWGQPVAVTRLWDVTADAGVSGTVTGPCATEPSDRWVVPGMATAGGAQAVLHLANPFDSDATVAITLPTPDGLLEPRLLENVVVPRRSVLRVDLNEHAPEQADLGVIVETRAGRVVAEAVQSFNAAIGGVEGLSLAAAALAPAETWTLPWFADDEGRGSWLWVTNPGDRAAAVELTVHTEEGGAVPEGFEELTLDPGVVQRIDLRGLLPEGTAHGALTVRSDNAQPIVAAVATQFTDDEPRRTGISVALGSPVADASWVLSGGPTDGREVAVHLVNPGGDDAVVDLQLWAGELIRPEALAGIEVPAGATATVQLDDHLPDGAPAHTVFVTAREGRVVAGRVATSSGDRRLDPVAVTGVALGRLAGGGTLPPIRFAPGMPHRIGTELGPHTVPDPLAPSGEAPATTPTDGPTGG